VSPPDRRRPPAAPWRPPTRRAFVALLGAAAATLAAPAGLRAVRTAAAAPVAPRTRWIGHG
jgi:hypothetical protein